MGGRGSGSSRGGWSKVSGTARQTQLISNLTRIVKRDYNTEPTFTKQKDGGIGYEYTKIQKFQDVGGGKFIDPRKNGMIEKTTIETGIIMPDGLIKKNKPQITKKIIKQRR